jgi:hypothetical protein
MALRVYIDVSGADDVDLVACVKKWRGKRCRRQSRCRQGEEKQDGCGTRTNPTPACHFFS